MEIYDYIILGGGAAGLSLAHRFSTPPLNKYKVLVIEKEDKKDNDRTWCSWVTRDDRYDHLALKTWDDIIVTSVQGEKIQLPLAPYRYRMIRSADFYQFIHKELAKAVNIETKLDTVVSVEEKDGAVIIHTPVQTYKTKHVFKSYFDAHIDKSKEMYVDQHFRGWFIESAHDAFDDHICHLMDFSIAQHNEVRFMYVLPIDKRNALVELAIFSNDLLSQSDYDSLISDYVTHQLSLKDFIVKETEQGIIPMTMHDFTTYNSAHITTIGAMAGAVKPSTGYAFIRIQEHIDAIVQCIADHRSTSEAQAVFKYKYKLYDATMMDVIFHKKNSGADFFFSFFKNSGAAFVFKFLDEKTTLWEETKAMIKMDWVKLGWSFVHQVWRGIGK